MIEPKPTISIYKHGDLKVMLVTNGHTTDEVLEAFDNVLSGSGFSPPGELIFDEDDEVDSCQEHNN